MPLNVCQTQKVVDRDIRALCDDCLDRPGCLKAAMHETVGLFAVARDEHKLSIITECDTYRPTDGRAAFKASLWPQLIAAGVRHNCHDCPAEEMKACDYRHELVKLTTTAKRRGEGLEVTVFCCGEVAPHRRLLTISEPGQGEENGR